MLPVELWMSSVIFYMTIFVCVSKQNLLCSRLQWSASHFSRAKSFTFILSCQYASLKLCLGFWWLPEVFSLCARRIISKGLFVLKCTRGMWGSALARKKINRANKKSSFILLSCISDAILFSLGSFDTIRMQADGKEVKFAVAPSPTLKQDWNPTEKESLIHQAITHNKNLLYHGCNWLVVSYISVSTVYSRKLSTALSQIMGFA